MDMPLEFCRTFWHVFAMMAPWLIIGFFIAVSIATITSLIGRRATFAYVAAIFLGAILSGVVVNHLAGNIGAFSVQCTACATLPTLNNLAGIALAILMTNAYIRVPKMR